MHVECGAHSNEDLLSVTGCDEERLNMEAEGATHHQGNLDAEAIQSMSQEAEKERDKEKESCEDLCESRSLRIGALYRTS